MKKSSLLAEVTHDDASSWETSASREEKVTKEEKEEQQAKYKKKCKISNRTLLVFLVTLSDTAIKKLKIASHPPTLVSIRISILAYCSRYSLGTSCELNDNQPYY